MNIILTPQTRIWVYRNHPVCSYVCHSVQKKKLNIDHNYWTKGDRDSILHMYILCDRTFCYCRNLTSNLDLDFWHTFEKKINLGYNVWTKKRKSVYIAHVFLCSQIFLLVNPHPPPPPPKKKIVLVTLTLVFDLLLKKKNRLSLLLNQRHWTFILKTE